MGYIVITYVRVMVYNHAIYYILVVVVAINLATCVRASCAQCVAVTHGMPSDNSDCRHLPLHINSDIEFRLWPMHVGA